MTDKIFSFKDPGDRQAFTGQRYNIGVPGDIQNEHFHRYLFALRFCDGRDVLDVASGEGYGASLIASVARSVVGVDIDEPSIAFASRAYTRQNLYFRTGNALALPLDDASVDTVVSFETIEHIADHVMFLNEVRRVLRPNGTFVISTPDKTVYSDEPGYKNPFHIHELYGEEFLTLLGTEFPYVTLFEQQVLAGSIMIAHDGASGVESFSTSDSWNFRHKLRLPRAPYLVAVASTEKLMLPSASVLEGLWTDIIVKDMMALRGELEKVQARLMQFEEHAARDRRRVMEMDRERGFLRAMLIYSRHLADQARAKHVHKRETFEAEIAAVRSAAEAQIVLNQALAQAQKNALLESTSWRITRPLRGFRRLFGRMFR